MTTRRLETARHWARELHSGQVDKLGISYVAHVADVAARVATKGEDYEIVGLLHDALEDTEATYEEIENRFGACVAEAVQAMTRFEGESYFEDYLPRLTSNPISHAVKAADSSHNFAKTHLLQDDELRTRFSEKYRKVLGLLGVNPDVVSPIHYDSALAAWIDG